jgi:hypothetical protein
MRFGTPPHPVACLFSDHVAPWRDMGCIFEVSELDFVNLDFIIVVLPVDEDVVWFDVYGK